MHTMVWRESSVFEFISLKRGGNLWNSNNSVMVDSEFWNYVHNAAVATAIAIAKHARKPIEKIRTFSIKETRYGPALYTLWVMFLFIFLQIPMMFSF